MIYLKSFANIQIPKNSYLWGTKSEGMIEVSNIHKSYGTLEVLKGISLKVDKGEIISVVGASGAGKSTLLHIIGTLDRPDAGTIDINGVNVRKLSDKKLAAFRNKHIGFVFQFHHLLPEFTALENVTIASRIAGNYDETKAKDLLNEVGLADRIHHKPSELSGGEAQRVAIERALVNSPKIILADEPTGSLDSKNAENLGNLLLEMNRDYGITIILATHSFDLAKKMAKILRLEEGKLNVLTGQ